MNSFDDFNPLNDPEDNFDYGTNNGGADKNGANNGGANNGMTNNGANNSSVPQRGAQGEQGMSSFLGRLNLSRRGHKIEFHPLGHATDTRARRRDRAGNPLSRVHVFLNPALADEKLVAETRLKDVLEIIARTHPAKAYSLWRRYDNVVLFKRSRFIEAQRLALRDLAARNEEFGRFNRALEARRIDLETERDQATAADRAAIVDLDIPLNQAHQNAAQKAALAGGSYEPKTPTAACVLRHTPTPLRALSGRDSIPFPTSEESVLGKGLALLGAAFTGLVLGPSFGVAVGLFNPKAALRGREADLIAFGLLWPVGTWFALKIRDWTKNAFFDASERYWLGLPARSWVGMWAQAIGFAFFILGLLCFIEQFGLLKLSALMNATGAGGQVVSAVGALALGATSAFYLGSAAWEGIVGGKNSACQSRLVALQTTEFEALDQSIRQSVPVQDALEAIARVQDLLRQKDALETRVDKVAAPFNQQIDELESQKREPLDDLDDATLNRLQDFYDDWFGANLTFERLLDRELDALEGSFWNRFLALFRIANRSRNLKCANGYEETIIKAGFSLATGRPYTAPILYRSDLIPLPTLYRPGPYANPLPHAQ